MIICLLPTYIYLFMDTRNAHPFHSNDKGETSHIKSFWEQLKICNFCTVDICTILFISWVGRKKLQICNFCTVNVCTVQLQKYGLLEICFSFFLTLLWNIWTANIFFFNSRIQISEQNLKKTREIIQNFDRNNMGFQNLC